MAKLIVGVNDLATVKPELIKEWDFDRNVLKPTEIMCGSIKKVWWKCDKGHEWCVSPNSRLGKGLTGCPYCSNKKVLKGYNDLMTVNPSLAKEWNYKRNGNLTPDMLTVSSSKNVWWLCEKGHEWQSTISHRSCHGRGCPYCAGQRVIRGENDLTILNPSLVKEWNYKRNGNLLPSMFKSNSSTKKVWWLCKKGHEWQSTIENRNKGRGCPYCSNRKVLKGYNDLATIRPDLLKEWDYSKNKDITPEMVTCGSKKKVWWLCNKGHKWESSIKVRNRGSGCPYCSGKKVWAGYNDLATLNPELIKSWNYKRNGNLKPEMVSYGSIKRVWWKCDKGHEWQANIADRNNGSGCPYCSGIYCKDREIYNFKTKLVIEGYFKCECQKCRYKNILTIDEMKKHYEKCKG